MKKQILYVFITLFTLAFSGTTYAANQTSVNLENSSNLIIQIDLGDITNTSDEELTAVFSDLNFSVDETTELTCTITVKGSVGVGSNYVEISISVSGPCEEARKMANQLLKDVKEMVKAL